MADISSTLPEGVEGPAFDDEFGDTYGSIYAFRAEGFSQRELRDRVEAIRSEILSLPDIGKVNILGAQDEQIVIEFSQSKLASLDIDPSSAIEAIRAQNSVNPIGTVQTSEEKISVRVTGAVCLRRQPERHHLKAWQPIFPARLHRDDLPHDHRSARRLGARQRKGGHWSGRFDGKGWKPPHLR